MKVRTYLSILSVFVFVGGIAVQPVLADGPGRSLGSRVGRAANAAARIQRVPGVRVPSLPGGNRSIRGGSPFPILGALGRAADRGGRGSSPFPILEALSRAGNDRGGFNTPFPILEALSRLDDDRGGKSHSSNALDFLYGLSQFGSYGGYPGYGDGMHSYYNSYYRNKSDEEYADAIRDAAIANAVGNVLTAVVSATSVRTQPPGYVQAVPGYVQPAPAYAQPAPPPVYTQPAPPTYAPPAPGGQYETRREVIGGGYYTREQIWVPEARDPRTGNIVEGHYETVRRWVPEVIQETQVWVSP
jgi:hypothetical protein